MFGQGLPDAGPFAPNVGIGCGADVLAVLVTQAEDRRVADVGRGVGSGGVDDQVVGEDRVAGLAGELDRPVWQVDLGHALS